MFSKKVGAFHMSELDALIRAKIPGEETGICVKHSLCDICSPGFHCGVDAYVKDGRIIKVEGTKEHPVNHGLLCTKGAANRQYIYRKDRIHTPLKRVGSRGEGKFREISWEEAYTEIADRLNECKAAAGADSVVFGSGYGKWYRPFLHRLAYSFGSVNYMTESSTCFISGLMAWKAGAGSIARPDAAHAKVYMGWAYQPYYSSYLASGALDMMKAHGTKIIVADPRITPVTERYADLHLRIKPGTDGALALGMANVIIQNGWQDKQYIEKYTTGYEEYAQYVSRFDLHRTAQITGLREEDIYTAAKWYATEGPTASNEATSTLCHHKNGFQNYRAITCLTALTGNFDREGGSIPMDFSYLEQTAGFHTLEDDFIYETMPEGHRPPVGADRFPLWNAMVHEGQAMALADQILSREPYPIEALVYFGMNTRMFPNTERLRQALTKLKFFVNVDLFMTEACRYADIVLPACSSLERGEFKTYRGGFATYTKPVIPPLYDSRPDVDIIRDLARYLELPDEKLKAGYRENIKYIISPLHITVEEMENSDLPVHVPDAKPFVPGEYTRRGYNTPSGKFEFNAAVVEQFRGQYGLSGVPTWPEDCAGPGEGEFYLTTGTRLPNALHSRLHDVPWLRSLRPAATADMNDADAARLGISPGDRIEIYNENGRVVVPVNVSYKIRPGQVVMYHGYEEANISQLVDDRALDPYSGYPAYKSTVCKIRKAEAAEDA